MQFWDSHHGTLLNAHSCHRGDVNALAAGPSHDRVFAADSGGQVGKLVPQFCFFSKYSDILFFSLL